MALELFLAIVTLSALGLAALRAMRSSQAPSAWRRWAALLCGSCILLVVAAGSTLKRPAAEPDIGGRPIQIPPPEYVTSSKCSACHPGEYASWRASYHSSMTQRASPQTVLGDFDRVLLRQNDWSFMLRREGDAYWVDMPDLDGSPGGARAARVQRQIVLTTGSHHMQAYWYASGNSRVLGMLPFVYNLELRRWVPRDASFIRPPEHVPASEIGRWNNFCIECHVVLGRMRPAQPHGLDTHVAEFGIACEGCHGPAAEHVAAYGNPLRRYSTHWRGGPGEQIVQPERLPHDRSSEVCGQCHSTSVWTTQEAIDDWKVHGLRYRPGDTLSDVKRVVRGKLEWNPPEVQRVVESQINQMHNTYWPDGMNRVSGREYNGLLETPCFQRGEMSCLSCHEMHPSGADARTLAEWADDQLKPGMRGNLACTQCHAGYESDARVSAHTHHAPQSSGSLCYNCHMPHTTYGLLKAIRSHHLDSPSVAVSVAGRRPNACNQCHLDRTLAWTARQLQVWYGLAPPGLAPEEHQVAASVLGLLRGDAGARALAAWSMGWQSALDVSGDDWQALYLGVLLGDPYDAVRHIAHRSLRRLPGFANHEYDFMASQQQLYRTGNTVVAQWLQQRPPTARVGDEILIDRLGKPRMDRLLELASQRDDRPVLFAE